MTQIIIEQCSLSTTFHQQMALLVHACEKLLCLTMSSGQSVWKRVTKLKVIIMGTDGQCGSCGKKMLKQPTFVIGYLQFVERRHLQWQLSMSGISTHLKNCSMKLEAPKTTAAMYNL